MATTIFKIVGGGQKIRQNIENKLPTIIEKVEDSDWPEKAGVVGVDAYANCLWATTEASVRKMAHGWAKGYGRARLVSQ